MADSLLPISATSEERDIEASTTRISDVPVNLRDAWNPDTCPSSLLPWLAWQFSVSQWDATWPDDVKRAVISASVDLHRHKGTVGSIRSLFSSIGFGDIDIDEGRERKKYDGSFKHDGFVTYGDVVSWAEYRIRLKKTLSTAQANTARTLLSIFAPARCHLFALDFTEAALIHNATAKYNGAFKYGVA